MIIFIGQLDRYSGTFLLDTSFGTRERKERERANVEHQVHHHREEGTAGRRRQCWPDTLERKLESTPDIQAVVRFPPFAARSF
jgi:hypothetical protein